jgi:serine/threonine protein kinase
MATSTPSRIGKYDVLGVLGRGGMGVVYKAIDPQIGRMVAIKVLLADFEDDSTLQRFYSEAQSTGQMQHPNIVTLYELGERDGAPYLVMEFLEGESLDKIIASDRQLPLTEMLSIVNQVCAGLHYAHTRKIIHRDIKPGNVVLLPEGSIKLVDFGIAKFGNDRHTRTGMVIGSVKYMSPEQISGAAVDARSVVYSTVVLLYELITKHVPFEGGDIGSTIHKVLTSPIPTLSEFIAGAPPRLDQILRAALAKKPEERYETAEDFAFDLAQLQDALKRDLVAQYLDSARAAISRRDWAVASGQLQLASRIDRHNSEAHELSREIRIASGAQGIPDRVRGLIELAERAVQAERGDDASRICALGLEIEPTSARLLELRLAAARTSRQPGSNGLNGAMRRGALAEGSATTWLEPRPLRSATAAVTQSVNQIGEARAPASMLASPPASLPDRQTKPRGGARKVAVAALLVFVAAIASAVLYRWRSAAHPSASAPAITAGKTEPQRSGPGSAPSATLPSAQSGSDLGPPAATTVPSVAAPPVSSNNSSVQATPLGNRSGVSPDLQAWQRIEKAPTLSDIDRFERAYPSSLLRLRAESEKDDLIWNSAVSSKTPAALNDYLARYPAGKHASAARNNLEHAELEAIDSEKDVVTLEGYLAKYPSGDQHARVVSRLDDITWTHTTKDTVGMDAYLSRFPNGKHADDARGILESARGKELRADVPAPALPAPSRESAASAASGVVTLDDKAAILTVLSSYQQAYNHQDLSGIERAWPGMSAQQRKGMADFFEQVKSVQMSYDVLTGPEINGTEAALRLSETINFSLGGAPKVRAAKVNVKLQKTSAGSGESVWRIVSIR